MDNSIEMIDKFNKRIMRRDSKVMKICLVCSSGGHFSQLHFLKEFWEVFDHFWVTFSGQDTSSLLRNEKVYWAYCPTNRNIKNLLRNIILAIKILMREKPDVIISTGAGVSVPFIYIAKILSIKAIYIESLTRINILSLSGKMVYPIVDHLIVQWPELEKRYEKAKFIGQVI